MSDKAILTIDGKGYEFPIVVGTEQERGIDIGKLRSQTGCITLDPGYVNTGSCKSDITFIDGERGILRYRGIPLEQFANGPNFIEVA
ncbi:MAG: citrate (Si)-synthase, partial [Gammaproteobacteria bacterium]|nr:citrate (Si)-synthase [Gammaproteobacteria bacterium]